MQEIYKIHSRYLRISVYRFAFNSKCEGILSENSWKYKLTEFFLLENNDLMLSKNCNNNKWHYKSMQGQIPSRYSSRLFVFF